MSTDPNYDVFEGFSDAASAILAYAQQDGSFAEMVTPMDDTEKFRLIAALVHLIVYPTEET